MEYFADKDGQLENKPEVKGAMPASCYDVSASTYASLVSEENNKSTPQSAPMGYPGVYANISVNLINFYNPKDGVLDIWLYDQEYVKPDINLLGYFYSYDGANGWFNLAYDMLKIYWVSDPQESRAMIARSLTLPIGRQAASGVIKSSVDLNAQLGFSDSTAEHSAQWTRPIQGCRLYYKLILSQLQITSTVPQQ